MKKAFKISTNIERDSSIDIDYIVTKNTNDVFDKIMFSHGKGQNSFTIIGSYGTGKSSFLWAIEKHLSGSPKFNVQSSELNSEIEAYQFIRIVGENSSFKHTLCNAFGFPKLASSSNKTILKELDQLISEIQENKTALVLLIDEFGKQLEYIAKNDADEMYFIQELCEYLNDPLKNVLFITTLHQNIGAYSKGLSKAQRSEWDKVRGRLLEITFDEPIEQLLYFASKRLAEYKPKNGKDFERLTKQIVKSNLLGKIGETNLSFFEDLYPLDALSADILTKTLQRYGQNERSLFTFLESEFIDRVINENRIFNVADCFDYLISNLNSEIEDSEKNPFKPQWKAATIALERAEFAIDTNYLAAAKIIKLICLVNIFSNSNGKLDEKVISNYSRLALGIRNPEEIIELLKNKNIIKYSHARNKFNFLDGTDVDIEQELVQAIQFIDSELNIVNRLKEYVQFDFVPAKRIQYQKGTPRFFEFRLIEELSIEEPKNEIDGFINVLVNPDITDSDLLNYSQEVEGAQIFASFKKISELKSSLFEIDKINYVISKYPDDKVALRVLNEERSFFQNQIELFLKKDLFRSEGGTFWCFKGQDLAILSEDVFNKTLSEISEKVYVKAPTFQNEMANKEMLSTPILTARKQLIKAIIDFGEIKDLGFSTNNFPPEKTIYLSLLKRTGIHTQSKGDLYKFQAPTDASFQELWNVSEGFLNGCKESRKAISLFYDLLKGSEFKLKQGFLDFWIPIYLIIKKEDYSLYSLDGEYIPHLTADIMDLIHKSPSRFLIKSLVTEGVNLEYFHSYKELVGYNESNIKGLESSYITIYSNFLRFYRGLEDYAKNTRQLSPEAIGVRDAIAKAKDPETALFELIPRSLGFTSLSSLSKNNIAFLDALKLSIKEIRTAYSNLVDTIESNVLQSIGITSTSFDDTKSSIINKYQSININLISNDRVKIFLNRVMSPLDVKHAYWESLADAVLSKRLDKIQDNEIPYLIEQLISNFNVLTDFIDLHHNSGSSKEEIIQLNFLSSNGQTNFKKNIVKKVDLMDQSETLKKKIEALLDKNQEINKITLVNILTDLLKD
jgi:hypothetical protein